MMLRYLNELPVNTFDSIEKWHGKMGPFRQKFVLKTIPSEPEWFISSVKLSNFPIGYIKGRDSNAAAGSSINKEEAVIKSLGEAIERYCLSNYFTIDKKFSKTIDISKSYARCADFENAPKGFKKGEITSKIEHSKVLRLIDDEVDFIPFEYIHLGFIRNPEIGLHTSGISSGCAFYPNDAICIWKGICEVLERHTFMRFWYLNFKGAKRILPQSIMKYSFAERYKRIREKGLGINIFEISDEFDIPVVFTIISSDHFPYYACGVSCNGNLIEALNKSLDEAISLRAMAIWNGYKKEIDTLSFEWVNKLEDHMELYANWKSSPVMQKLFDLDCEILDVNKNAVLDSYETVRKMGDLKQIASEFKDKGYDIFYKDLTMPEVQGMGKVYKVVIPKMIPLSQSYGSRWLDYFVKNGTKRTAINPYPQPFS